MFAIVITISAAVYQRLSGPTYPKKYSLTLNNQNYTFKLPRSYGENKNCEIKLNISDPSVTATLKYRRYPTADNWKEIKFVSNGESIIAELPKQPPAGKLQYQIQIYDAINNYEIGEDNPLIIRFKGAVPLFILIPHILFMFFAMLLSNLTGIMAIAYEEKYRFYTIITTISLLIGGLILGPIVQKYAFGEFWTGIPFGWDLTDNKLLIGFIFWILAFIANLKHERRVYAIIASVVLLLIYTIPHSMFGSELNYETGKIVTGSINALFIL